MTDALAAIVAIPGVTGAALFAPDDRCIAAVLRPPYDELRVERAMRTLRPALRVLTVGFESEATWSGLLVRCEGGHLIVRRIGDHTVLVLADASANVAMITARLDVSR